MATPILANLMVKITPGRSLSSVAASPEELPLDPAAAEAPGEGSGVTPLVISNVLESPAGAPAPLVGLNHPGVSDMMLLLMIIYLLLRCTGCWLLAVADLLLYCHVLLDCLNVKHDLAVQSYVQSQGNLFSSVEES